MSAFATPPTPPIRVLYIAAQAGGGSLLAQALAAQSEGQVQLVQAIGAAAALEQLAAECTQALYLHHAPAQPDVELIDAIRTAGFDQPIIILTGSGAEEPAGDAIAALMEAGATACCPLGQTTPRALLAITRRAITQAAEASEGRRLMAAERRRLAQEHREAERLLDQQRRLIGELQSLGQPVSVVAPAAPAAADASPAVEPRHASGQLTQQYHDLLQAHVIMGDGHLAAEISQLASKLIAAGMTGRQAIDLHLSVVEELVAGLGARSARHVMSRADLLVLELMVHLVDGYRQQYDERPAA